VQEFGALWCTTSLALRRLSTPSFDLKKRKKRKNMLSGFNKRGSGYIHLSNRSDLCIGQTIAKMKIVLTGSLGNVSRPLAEILIRAGHSVTIISSDPEKKEQIHALGARAAIGSVTDAGFMEPVFAGADAVYTMVPPDFTVQDPLTHYRKVASAYAEALTGSGVKKIVHLSSWGADLPSGTGYILGSHFAEGILDRVPGSRVTHLRAGFIYYNLFHFVDIIRATGMIAANYGEEDRIVMVSPADIAAAAAEELQLGSDSKGIRYVASDDRRASQVASVLGGYIGKPDLQWKRLTDDQQRQRMESRKVPQHVIENTLQLGQNIHNGSLRRHFDQTAPHVFGKIKLEDFAREFALIYNKV